jgi:hypothetical protein
MTASASRTADSGSERSWLRAIHHFAQRGLLCAYVGLRRQHLGAIVVIFQHGQNLPLADVVSLFHQHGAQLPAQLGTDRDVFRNRLHASRARDQWLGLRQLGRGCRHAFGGVGANGKDSQQDRNRKARGGDKESGSFGHQDTP